MDFGQALLTMKHGNKVARAGWQLLRSLLKREKTVQKE